MPGDASYRWHAVAASVRGVSHQRAGTERQDAWRLRVRGDRFVAVVCDGAGSAPLGRSGAETAARTARKATATALRDAGSVAALADEAARGIAAAARAAVEHRAGLEQRPLRDYATTFICLAVDPTGAICLHIGDGAAVVLDAGEWRVLSAPEHGAYVNETIFLTDAAMPTARLARLTQPPEAVALFSDGIEPLVLHAASGAAHTPFFARMTAPLATARPPVDRGLSSRLRGYLASPELAARTDDDITLIMARRMNREAAPLGAATQEEAGAPEAPSPAPTPTDPAERSCGGAANADTTKIAPKGDRESADGVAMPPA